MHVGSTIPRKRIDILLRILAAFAERNPRVRLIRVGGPLTGDQRRRAEDLGVMDRVLTMPFVDRNQLAALYRRAAMVIQPSEAEGFGLPVIEAMACGTVVLASDIPVFREVAGEAAIYCPLEDIPGWVGAASMLLAERESDPSAWQLRKKRCEAQAGRYSWSATAAAVAAIHCRRADPVTEYVGEGVL
jgi:glycosyltransferase involved in cell wall biosynthesis